MRSQIDACFKVIKSLIIESRKRKGGEKMTEKRKATVLLIIAIIYCIAPDFIPGPIDDFVVLYLAAMKRAKAKKLEG